MVAAGFTLRKIRTVYTLGEKLRRARKRKGVDLIESELATKVRAKYLEALENEDFDLLPTDIYVKGFINAYSTYLGLDPEKIYSLYRQQRAIRRGDKADDFSAKKFSAEKIFVVTPKIITIFIAAAFCVSAVVYIVFQVLSFASVPKLIIDSPQKDMVVNSDTVTVAGKTDSDAKLRVNKEEVSANSDGSFSKEITLQNGLNTIIVTATSKTEKEASRVIIIEKQTKTAESIVDSK